MTAIPTNYCRITGQELTGDGAATGITIAVTARPVYNGATLNSYFELQQSGLWAQMEAPWKSNTPDNTGAWYLDVPQAAICKPAGMGWLIQTWKSAYTGPVPNSSGPITYDALTNYGWAAASSLSTVTLQLASGAALGQLSNQLIYPGYGGGSETIVTTITGSTIVKTYPNLGITETVTISGSVITTTWTQTGSGAVLHTNTTTISGSTISEVIA